MNPAPPRGTLDLPPCGCSRRPTDPLFVPPGRHPLFARLLSDVDYFLFPRGCLVCAGRLPAGWPILLCRGCRGRLTPVEGPTCLICRAAGRSGEGFTAGRRCRDPGHEGFRLWAAVQMVDPADGLVHALKFNDRPEAGVTLALLMARRLRSAGVAGWSALVPMPLHPARRRARGYNQAAEIAIPLAARLGARVEERILVRRRATRAQADLDHGERAANVAQAFALRRGRRAGEPGEWAVRGRRLLLVDDVATTGHTLLEALKTLRAGEPESTGAVVFALA